MLPGTLLPLTVMAWLVPGESSNVTVSPLKKASLVPELFQLTAEARFQTDEDEALFQTSGR